MNGPPDKLTHEVQRIKRVSDLMCSCHNALRDRYARRALALDLAVMALTLWLTAMAFVDPHLGFLLTPAGMEKDLWLGLVSVFAFFLAILQFRVDWKGRSDAHARALQYFSRTKQLAGQLLSGILDEAGVSTLLALYQHTGEFAIPIDDSDFLPLKQRHRLKIEISRYLDEHPGASMALLRARLWIRHNF